ncbi:MAG: hypothetical protein U0M60_22450 [Clostridia bacterium]|nr:hypothetical protein [Clostridia bacterium]
MQNQIEAEMLEIIEKSREEWSHDVTDHTENEYIREGLLNAGYRRQSEVIDEFAKKLKEAPIKCGIPLLGLSTKEEIEEYFNGIMLQVRDAIDSIAKEMKGEGR